MLAGMVLLVAMLVACTILAFGLSGLRTLAATALAALALAVMMPLLVLRGMSPLVVAVPAGMLVACGLFLIGGPDRKSVSAAVGAAGALLVAGMVPALLAAALQFTGLDHDFGPLAHFEVRLWYDEALGRVDFARLIVAAIVLASLGAVMDVSMTVASALDEIVSADGRVSRAERFAIGCRVGAKALGPMTATMIFVFVGSDLVVNVARATQHPGVWDIMRLANYERLASEGMEALTAGVGLFSCIPLTALCAAMLLREKDRAAGGRMRR